jgi:hypothetical protein
LKELSRKLKKEDLVLSTLCIEESLCIEEKQDGRFELQQLRLAPRFTSSDPVLIWLFVDSWLYLLVISLLVCIRLVGLNKQVAPVNGYNGYNGG